MKDENMGFAAYLLFQGLLALTILGMVLDYITGQLVVTTGALVGVMVLTAAYQAFGVWYLWRRLYHPLRELDRLAERWTEMENPSEAARSLPGMVGGVAQSVRGRMEELDRRAAALQRFETERSEGHIRAGLLAEICRSTLPRIPEQSGNAPSFALAGALESPGRGSCCFYDCFFLEPTLLCVMTAEVGGGEIADALFLTAAQTTLRNRLRTDGTLEKAINNANTQLYDFGRQRSVSALIGTLNLKNGRFNYINAGGPQALIMRNDQERYEVLASPPYSAMGLNRAVSYRPVEVRLRQGDRIFVGTSGLYEARNPADEAFREKGLRTALNKSGKRAYEPSKILRYVTEETAVWIGPRSPLPCFAALLLEYLRSATDLPYCEALGNPESLPEVMRFFWKQCEENGLQERNYKRLSVMVEELFTLCCRYSEGTMRVECAVALNGESVNVRITANMGGRNPLENPEDMTMESAVDFISSHADYTEFQSENGEDSVTMVCFPE